MQNAAEAAYIHTPFCAHRCGYCNFTVVAGREDLIEQYLAALEKELGHVGEVRPVRTLYVGGGTPTFLPPSDLTRLLQTVLQWHPLLDDYEFTVEANPLDITPMVVELLAKYGVNRLSLGGQSFHDHKLSLLERDHNAFHIERAVGLAKACLASVSLDLIFGVPGESLDDWKADLESAVSLRPNHLSTYGLTYEKGTSFWSRRRQGRIMPVDEEAERCMYLAAIDRLTAAGYQHYEVSSFGQPGHRSRHNETYWTGRSYFAAGPGAARFLGGRREMNHQSTTTYIKRMLAGESPVAQWEQLSPHDAARERLVFGLRRLEGVDIQRFADQTGYTIDQLSQPAVERFVAQGFLERTQQRLRLTREGLLISDSLWPYFLEPAADSF